jgi:hypothetical protein
MYMNYFKHETTIIDEGCSIGAGTKIWHFSHVMEGSVDWRLLQYWSECSGVARGGAGYEREGAKQCVYLHWGDMRG